MTRSNHNRGFQESKINFLQDNIDCPQGQNVLPVVQKHLALVDRQYIADKLSVNQATICRWISGEKQIPSDRYLQILREAKCFHRGAVKASLDHVTAAEEHIELLLLMQHGRIE